MSNKPLINSSGNVILHINEYTSTAITDPIDIIQYADSSHALVSQYLDFSTVTAPGVGGLANTPIVDNFSITPDEYKINVYEIGLLSGRPLIDTLSFLHSSRKPLLSTPTEIIMTKSKTFTANPPLTDAFEFPSGKFKRNYTGFYMVLDAEIHAKASITFDFSGSATSPAVVIKDRGGITKLSTAGAFTIDTNGSKSNITSDSVYTATGANVPINFDTEYINTFGDPPSGYITGGAPAAATPANMVYSTATTRAQLLTGSTDMWTAATKYWSDGVNSWGSSGAGNRIKKKDTSDYILFIVRQDIELKEETKLSINFEIGESLSADWSTNVGLHNFRFSKFGMNAFLPILTVIT